MTRHSAIGPLLSQRPYRVLLQVAVQGCAVARPNAEKNAPAAGGWRVLVDSGEDGQHKQAGCRGTDRPAAPGPARRRGLGALGVGWVNVGRLYRAGRTGLRRPVADATGR